ncbi:nuclear RNA export factor 1 [Periplaneta americana]|uniref:nuclear RNA export factor 1 n=1 Tax=Periplaneta americana TaxID=6978 RepID=UPI0037E7B9AF
MIQERNFTNMPKRNKGNRIWNSEGGAGREGKYYYEHDDRGGDIIRRVSFKPGSNRIGKHRTRDLDMAIRAHVEDDDVDMAAPGSSARLSGRFNPYSGRARSGGFVGGGGAGGRSSNGRRRSGRNSPPITTQFTRKKFPEHSASWYKVTLPHGGKYSKEYILKTLLANVAPIVFIPLAYEVRGSESSFYVDDSYAAEKLASIDRRITTTKGFKLLVKVKPGIPRVELDSELKEKIKGAMVKRYNANLKALDLSRFHTDQDLVDNYAVALFRPNMMIAVLNIIVDNIPELAALDLSNNKLYSVENLSVLSHKIPNLKVLHIGKNRIRNMHQLDCLEGLRLEELVLDGNPLCDKYQDQTVYVSEVRKRFPKVLKLDGVELAPPILFDVNEDFQMPTNKRNFFCAEGGMSVARQFLEQYYQIYDSDDRQPLINAYHNDALFSITSTYPPGQSSTTNSKLANYISDSRNLLRVKDNIRRQRLLYQGKMSVITCLTKLPKTQHDPLSFAVDLSVCTPQLMMLTVSGVFLEPSPTRNQALRSFNRVFVIVPFGEGFCIVNEELFVTNATDEQTKAAFKTPPVVMSPPTPAPTPVPVAVAGSPHGALIDDNTKQQMVEAFAAQSGMNLSWTKKCLDETNWDFNHATYVFTQLKEQGKVPAEAFIK